MEKGVNHEETEHLCGGLSLVLAERSAACRPGGGCGEADDTLGQAGGPVTIAGAVQKGPFVLGSSVAVIPIDANGNPLGKVCNTQTVNDLEEFRVEFDATGALALEGDGYYSNEITGQLSASPLTLRAFFFVSEAGEQEAYLNLFTHLSYNRVQKLLQAGTPFTEAVVQAEDELRAALGLGPADFVPKTRGVKMNILGGDSDENAYLLAVSAVLLKAAADRGGPIDANMQEIANTLAHDMEDGSQEPELAGEIWAA